MIVLETLRRVLGRTPAAERCLALTEPKDNPLRRLAERESIRVIDHDPGIGGRFSVLSPVGVLPALIAGLDAEALRRGAEAALSETLSAKTPRAAPAALGAAVTVGLAELHNLRVTVLMPYADQLAPLGLWYRQLGREPRQERQGHDADPRARRGRPA
jgi:glucose-6-phosphate isomerase